MILAIDTSTKYFSIAISDPQGKKIDETFLDAKMQHSEILFDKLSKLFKKNSISLEHISKVASTLGPGSFTGIRVGLSFSRTLSQIYSIPLVGISTLDLLVYQLLSDKLITDNKHILVCPIISAVRDEIYTATYLLDIAKSKLKRKLNYIALNIHNLLSVIGYQLSVISSQFSVSTLYFTGDGVIKYKNILKNIFKSHKLQICFPKDQYLFPHASILAKIASTKKGTSFANAKPLYVKPPRIYQ